MDDLFNMEALKSLLGDEKYLVMEDYFRQRNKIIVTCFHREMKEEVIFQFINPSSKNIYITFASKTQNVYLEAYIKAQKVGKSLKERMANNKIFVGSPDKELYVRTIFEEM